MKGVEIDAIDEELMKGFAMHHVRMGEIEESALKKLIQVSGDIVEQLSKQGLDPSDIAFIMIEMDKQNKKAKKKEFMHDMAFV